MDNQCMMQYFEWELPPDGLLWRRAAAQAKNLKNAGIDILWLPPAYKGAAGASDVGYAVYDTYDLGEFDQKGSVRTKYGTRAEYLQCIRDLQKAGISVLADIVLGQRIGADETEMVGAVQYDPENRLHQISGEQTISAWTKYEFKGRGGQYSNFTWDWTCFKGIDYDAFTKQGGVYQFDGKNWSQNVDDEKGNYDYLMGADVDMSNERVVQELHAWGKWYLKTTKVNGFRLDALKHIDRKFYAHWLDAMSREAGRPLYAVGEYWSGDVQDLLSYLKDVSYKISLFDVPLHFNFHHASVAGGGFGMNNLLDHTLIGCNTINTVTFVDNHDSQPGQALESWVEPWFKPLAYAVILLRKDGLPCIFYADYYGLRADGSPAVPGMGQLLAVRLRCAYGEQRDYFDHENVVGWTRLGDNEHKKSGCAVLMTDGPAGEKQMYVGEKFAGQSFYDVMDRDIYPVIIDAQGCGVFRVPGGGLSVWLPEDAYADIVVNVD